MEKQKRKRKSGFSRKEQCNYKWMLQIGRRFSSASIGRKIWRLLVSSVLRIIIIDREDDIDDC